MDLMDGLANFQLKERSKQTPRQTVHAFSAISPSALELALPEN
jgi:hypothetical protein